MKTIRTNSFVRIAETAVGDPQIDALLTSQSGWIDPQNNLHSSLHDHLCVADLLPHYAQFAQRIRELRQWAKWDRQEFLRQTNPEYKEHDGIDKAFVKPLRDEKVAYRSESEDEADKLSEQLVDAIYDDGWVKLAVEGQNLIVEGYPTGMAKARAKLEKMAEEIGADVEYRVYHLPLS